MRPSQPSRDDVTPAKPGARLSIGRLVVFGLLCFVLVVGHLGCSNEAKRYETLAFFFDGVPVPESLRDRYPEEEPTTKPASPWDPESAPKPDEVEQIQYVFHQPYTSRKCFGCHDQERGYEVIAAGPELCGKCHSVYLKRTPGDWLHGPVIIGECRMCHEPHKSEYEGLLTSSQPQLCFRCHDPSFIARDPFHRELDDQTCSNCHDPHAAGNRKLLADARTYSRNENAARRLGSDHPDWGKGQCQMCHQTEAAMVLVDDVNAVCLNCHRDQAQPPSGQAVHSPVAQGNCIACHTPHDSPRPHLIRPKGEQLCVGCHPLEKVNTADHPRVTRVDCLLCHQGHHSEREKLLRKGIGEPVPDRPPDASAPSLETHSDSNLEKPQDEQRESEG